jgi:SAM-dependent methyltransferase
MPTDYNAIAAQYQKAKRHPWRMHIEHFTFFSLLGDLHGKAVLDLACGEGFFTRFIKQAGVGRVVGIDISAGMIDLARAEEAAHPLGIEYQVHDVKYLTLRETFDLVVAAYLLNYASTEEDLGLMCQGIARALKPGCRFVTVNNNPDVESFADGQKYGFIKSCAAAPAEGTPITWTFLLDEGPLPITNYHLSRATHEKVLRASGFRDLRWHSPQVSPAGVAANGREFWSAFLERPPVIFLEATRA